jgi:hypothetical protein
VNNVMTIDREIKDVRKRQVQQIKTLGKALSKSINNKGNLSENFESQGNVVDIKYSGTVKDSITVRISNHQGRDEMAVFLTVLGAAEYVIMNV